MPRSLGRWGTAEITVSFRQFMWMEEIIQLADSAITSCRDPGSGDGATGKFCMTVEGLTKSLAETLARLDALSRFHVRVVNLAEGYDTFAEIAWPEC